MGFFDIPLLKMLTTRLSYEGERQAVLSGNLANIDTPGYRARDLEPLTFKDMLVGGASRLPMAVTSPVHISQPGGFTTQFSVIEQTQGVEGKPNGNNVNLEQQMAKVAANQTDFQLSTSIYQAVGNLFKTALGPTQ